MFTSSSRMKKTPKELSMISTTVGLLEDQYVQNYPLSLTLGKPAVVSMKWENVLVPGFVTSCTSSLFLEI
jgi:hypothetical protein